MTCKGGGGGGDRFKVEKMFSMATSAPGGKKFGKAGKGWSGGYTGTDALGSEWTVGTYAQLTELGAFRILNKGVKPSSGAWEDFGPGRYRDFNLKDYMGIHRGGAGGGGAGFKESAGGLQIGWLKVQSKIKESSIVGYNRKGKGNNILTVDGNLDLKNSYGGDGGNYGQKGAPGQSFTKALAQMPFLLEDETKGREGGAAVI